ncbi:MAG: TraR/DksA family transcriptional regulator [Nitrospirae bacterium]|nr:TraR/DksA family transcriptional regulator [Nitrospirota bacterium]
MASRKPEKAEKKVAGRHKASRPAPVKKKSVNAPGKPGIRKESTAASARKATTRKVMIKTPAAGTKKKEVKKKKKTALGPARAKKTVAPAPQAKQKLTPRERKIQEIKKTLMAQRNALLCEAEEALNALPGQTIFPDMGDQASAEIDRSFMLRLRGREQRLLKKIEQAIEKIDTGIFGICDVCGEEITIKRLEARPVTTMCIFCKTEQEEEEKLRGL